MKRLGIIAPLAVALSLALAGCPSGTTGGSSGPAPSYSSIFPPDTPTAGADSKPQPVNSADAAPLRNVAMECHDYFATPTGITISSYNVMTFGVTIFCTVPPTGQITTVTLQLWSTKTSRWTNYSTQVHYTIPSPKPVLFGGVSPSCFPGLWRVSYFILASQYGQVFYQPAKGTLIYSVPRRITKSECS